MTDEITEVASESYPKETSEKEIKKPKVKKEKTLEQDKPHTLTFQEKFAQYAMSEMEAIDKHIGIGGQVDNPYKLSSGSLMLDLVYSGGVRSGWYTVLGGEASAKSTNCINLLGEAVRNNIPCYYFDGEGSVDGTYAPQICRVNDLSDLFGSKTSKGKTDKFARARYYDDTTMEKVFGVIKERLLNLPDKKYVKEENQWYLCFNPERKTQLKMMTALELEPTKKSKTEYACPIGDYGDFQAIFFLDSYPSFLPQCVGEDETQDGQGVALVAREYAKWVPQIKGLLRRKHCVIYGVNQLRDKPMAMYCFQYNSMVDTEKGRLPIGYIVENKLKLKVPSYNENTKAIEYKNIINWWDNGNTDDWLDFKFNTKSKNGISGFRCTPNHQLYDANLKVFKDASLFKVGDSFLTYQDSIQLNDDSNDILLGSLLGDGNLKKTSSKGYVFRLTHGTKQQNYLQHKMDILSIPYTLNNKKASVCADSNTIYSIKLENYYNEYTSSKYGSRTWNGIPSDCYNLMNNKILAIWYQDDGSYYKSELGKNGGYSEQIYISCKRLANQNLQKLCDAVNKLGYNFRIYNNKLVMTDKQDIDYFFKNIAQYIHTDLSYKIKDEYKNLCGSYKWIGSHTKFVETSLATITSIKSWKVPYGHHKQRYDLQIEGNSNYFVCGALVHNSKPTCEPCGNALKYNSDVRTEFTSISVSSVKTGVWDKGESSSEGEEDSVEYEGKVDKYQYKKLVNTKNKKGTPFKFGYQRIWFKDGKGKGRGIDPVFDVWMYLCETNQYDGDRKKKFTISLKGYENINFNWKLFKQFIIAEVYKSKQLKDSLKEQGYERFDIRKQCLDQLKSNEYQDLINEDNVDESSRDEYSDSDDDEFETEDL